MLAITGSLQTHARPAQDRAGWGGRLRPAAAGDAALRWGLPSAPSPQALFHRRHRGSRVAPTPLRAAPPGPEGEGEEGGKEPAGVGAEVTSFLANLAASPLSYVAGGLVAIKVVSSTGDSAVPVLLLAALPITGLTALSKTSFGSEVQQQLEERLPELQAASSAAAAARAESRARSPYFGAARPKFLGPFPFAYPAHLTGELAGDAGFDPFSISNKAGRLEKMREAELLHARWAMLAIVGALLPEALSTFAGVDIGETVWWRVGAAKLSGDVLNYGGLEGFRIAGGQGIAIIAACQVVLMGGPEVARYVGIKGLEPVGIFLPGDSDYPGGEPFDPLNFAADPDNLELMKVAEIKNGRLAMVAMAGLGAQAAATGAGPVENLAAALKL